MCVCVCVLKKKRRGGGGKKKREEEKDDKVEGRGEKERAAPANSWWPHIYLGDHHRAGTNEDGQQNDGRKGGRRGANGFKIFCGCCVRYRKSSTVIVE